MHPLPFGGREYNALVDSTADEVAKLKATQQAAMAQQMKLDEESLQRLAAEKEAAKVVPGPACMRQHTDRLLLRDWAVLCAGSVTFFCCIISFPILQQA